MGGGGGGGEEEEISAGNSKDHRHHSIKILCKSPSLRNLPPMCATERYGTNSDVHKYSVLYAEYRNTVQEPRSPCSPPAAPVCRTSVGPIGKKNSPLVIQRHTAPSLPLSHPPSSLFPVPKITGQAFVIAEMPEPRREGREIRPYTNRVHKVIGARKHNMPTSPYLGGNCVLNMRRDFPPYTAYKPYFVCKYRYLRHLGCDTSVIYG